MDGLKNRSDSKFKANDTIGSRFNQAIVKHFKRADMFGTNDNLFGDDGPTFEHNNTIRTRKESVKKERQKSKSLHRKRSSIG